MDLQYKGSSSLYMKGMCFLHHVVEIAPLNLYENDSLQITWDIMIRGYTNNEKTSEMPFQFSALFKGQRMQVRFVEVIWRGGPSGEIQCHEEMPTV